jgi:purine-binding chemotaxis protein CheW
MASSGAGSNLMASSGFFLHQTDEAEMQTLVRRARELAQTPEDAVRSEVDVLLIRLGDEHYAVELELLRSVLRPPGLTAVPCAPTHIAGIVNVRGEIITVVDLRAVLGLSRETPAAERWVVLVELPQGRLGLSVDEVLGMSKMPLEALDRSMTAREYIAGIHDGTTILLDLTLLLTHERLGVHESVT